MHLRCHVPTALCSRSKRRTKEDVGEIVGPEDAAAGREELRQRHVRRQGRRAGNEQDAGEEGRVDGAVAVRARRQHHVREAAPGNERVDVELAS